MKMLIVALLLLGLSFPVTTSAATAQKTEPIVTKMNAQIQVGNQESQIKFWRTDNPRERQATVTGLSALIVVGLVASWARRRFY
ncbi:hypothetical protein IWT5_01183 [Secundilactobacillus silagincola]|uniref:Uncharacterized protein n=1 Tax=Secundilactobacillus silagincola TaxID=1714681 RepID=A0A1Z5J2J9_9LACO|nr:hypothetical protein [Secundilactobacillus silagincola]GAX08032.1 hypothetical protein IWT5_01183 [Secundilactobacillus silagincola]